jgi:predicted ArsR family transcriptional regulator
MANISKVPETVKALRGFKSPAALAAELGINETAARARINAVAEAGYTLDTRQGVRNGDRGRHPTEYRVTGKPAAK